MIPLEQVTVIPARWRPVLTAHGIVDARTFAAADADDIDGWFADDARVIDAATGELEPWPKPHQVRMWQTVARTQAEAEAPTEPKWFMAVHDLSDEGTLPHKFIPSGERVNLFYRTDEQVERLIELGIIARIGDDVHLLVREAWLPAPARRLLNGEAIYSLEAMVGGVVNAAGQAIDVPAVLAEVEPDKARVQSWLDTARTLLAMQGEAVKVEEIDETPRGAGG